uniref:Uncharacterized protein LOC104228114 n=1 Tax=Nicotiana sylvestris TaxID=4096 RepID=A0A1U7WFS6_NICSY|nr:PREDICTED: uncharacterized protein LOC104228114 [Nicotiana sylvestris]
MPRKENKRADALVALAFILSLPDQTQVSVCQRWVVPPPNDYEEEESEVEHIASILEVEIEDWRSFDGVLLCCLGADESLQALQEAHSGVCGVRQSGPKLHFHIKRMGYYWPTMVKDCLITLEGVKLANSMLTSYINHLKYYTQLLLLGHLMLGVWMLLVHCQSLLVDIYIFLAVTDYFSKWAKAFSLKEVKKENVANFIRVNIVYRFGIPRYILTDNAVLPLERQILSLRLAIQEGLTDEVNARLRLE